MADTEPEKEDRVAGAEPSLYRRAERRIVSGGMAMVVFFLERIVLRAARKSRSR